ncbi:MAG: toprim domain-containing protein [bacterium]
MSDNKTKVEPRITDEEVTRWHQALTEELRTWYRSERGLTDEVIDMAMLGFDGQRLTIPISDVTGSWLFAKRRRLPNSEEEPRYLYPAGAGAALYGAQILKKANTIVIAEGELDTLALLSRGILAVSSTGGAKTFPEEWAEEFKTIPAVFIVYDNDDAGREGALKVARLIPHAKIVALPEEVGDKGDTTDFLVKLGKSKEDFLELLKGGKTYSEIQECGDRFRPLPPPAQEIELLAWRETIEGRFPECLAAAEVGAAVLSQLLIKDVRNPFGLVYVDVPSAGKTITLNFFSEIPDLIYSSDHFTTSALVSHATNRSRTDLEKIDLLPRIRHRMLIVRDLAPLFAERQENLLKSLGVLTRVFDGEGYESDSGVHGKRGYKGDYTFMFLAGSTPIAPRVWKFMGNLGSRLFFLNLNSGDKTEEELADLLAQNNFKIKEAECRNATRDLILTLWQKHPKGIEWDKYADPVPCRRIISRCAMLLTHLRGTVNVWSDGEDAGKQNHTNVVIEKPTRINQLFYNLARGSAILNGRTQITEADLWPVIEVAFNSAQYNRIKLLNVILENNGTVTTGLVEQAIGCSNPTALHEIETLRVLGIVNVEEHYTGSSDPGRPEKVVTLKNDFDWFFSDECKCLRVMKPGPNKII